MVLCLNAISDYKTAWKPPFYEHRREKHGIFQRNSKYKRDLELSESLCDLCGFAATSKRAMRLHKKSLCELKNNMTVNRYLATQVESKNKNRNCSQCDFQATSFYQLNAHKMQNHNIILSTCSLCGMKCRNLPVHMSSKHPANGLGCDMCDFNAHSVLLLKQHKDKAHLGISYPCDQCDYTGPGKTQLQMHQKRVHAEHYILKNHIPETQEPSFEDNGTVLGK